MNSAWAVCYFKLGRMDTVRSSVAFGLTANRLARFETANCPVADFTFTATVTDTSTGITPTGTVTFKDVLNGVTTTPGTGSLVDGMATFSTSSLAVGNYTIEAFFNVTTDFLASSGNVLEKVNPPHA